MVELFRSDSVLVRASPGADTRRWVVTFDNYGLGPGLDRPGFGEDFLAGVGVSAIHILGVGDDWYQYPEMTEALAAARAGMAGAERVMTYGSSMGAYAAIRFADAVAAHAVLAISPQYSIDPERVPFEGRWLADARRIRFLPDIEDRLTCAARPLVIYDAAGDDRLHAEMIAAEVQTDLIGVRNLHHPATTALAEMGLLGGLMMLLLAGPVDVPTIRRRIRAARSDSVTCVSRIAERQPPHRSRLAQRLLEGALKRAPGNANVLVALAGLLSRGGEPGRAASLLEAALAADGSNVAILVPYSQALLLDGRIEAAAAAAEAASALMPLAPHLHVWRGAVEHMAGRDDMAQAAFEQALALDPGNETAQDACRDLCKQ